MQLTLISRNYGTQTIDTQTFRPLRARTDSTIYQIVEHIFEQWFENAHSSQVAPYQHNYEGGAAYNKRGAINQAMDLIIDIAEERDVEALTITTRELQNWDIEAAFE